MIKKNRIKKLSALSPLERAIKNATAGCCCMCGGIVESRKGFILGGKLYCCNCFGNKAQCIYAASPQGRKVFLEDFARKLNLKNPKPKNKGRQEFVKIIFNATESNRRKH